jgi:hypothetical protein
VHDLDAERRPVEESRRFLQYAPFLHLRILYDLRKRHRERLAAATLSAYVRALTLPRG